MTGWNPRLDVLPLAQQALWPKLADIPPGFVLYGGTAIALRLGHRQSVDFDFFSTRPFQHRTLRKQVPWLTDGQTLQSETDTLTVVVGVMDHFPVQVSFFGGLQMGRVSAPDSSSGVAVASLIDLAAAKMAVIQRRAEKKDYVDIAAILNAGIRLEDALAAAVAVHGPSFNPSITLKALCFYQDGNLDAVDASTRKLLTKAASGIGELPEYQRVADDLC